jgi:hypothetical protein
MGVDGEKNNKIRRPSQKNHLPSPYHSINNKIWIALKFTMQKN